MEIPIELIAFIGIAFGVIGRTLLPYFKKLEGHPDLSFEIRYITTAIMSGIVTAIFIFPTFVIPEETMFLVFISAVVFAWGANDLVNKMIK